MIGVRTVAIASPIYGFSVRPTAWWLGQRERKSLTTIIH